MPSKKPEEQPTPEGRFYALQQELAPARRGHYHLTPELVLPMPTRRQLKAFRAAPDDETKLAALIGDQFEQVDALYDQRPADEWMAFQKDYYAHFFGSGAQDIPGGSTGS